MPLDIDYNACVDEFPHPDGYRQADSHAQVSR